MQSISIRRPEALNTIIAIVSVVVIGIGTATAAISVAPQDEINPAMRPLATGSSIHLQPAFGADDEDCVWAMHKIVQPNGKTRLERKLECAQ